MAERSVLTLSQQPSKTQESMRSKLEEWRKVKQQQTAKQLKQQTVPLKTPNRVKPQVSQQKATSVQPKSKETSLSKPSLAHRKRKSFHVLLYDTAGVKKITDENTAEESCQTVNIELNINEIKRRNSKIQKSPETFEIESAPDSKRARKSTFTIETLMKEVGDKNIENPKRCEKDEQNLRNKLEIWRENKRKVQATPTIPKSLKLHIKPQNSCNRKDGSNSEKNCVKTMDPGKCNQVCTVKKFPNKNGPPTQAQKVSQITKSKVGPKDTVNLPRTPLKKLLPHMDKTLSMRERLELWRKEKGKTEGVTKTPATLRRKSTMPSRRKDHKPITMETQEPLQLEPFDTMYCDMAEKKPTPEEIRQKLQNCLEKIQEDKTNDDMIANQLDEIQDSHPGSLQCAEFWICRAKIAEHEEDDGRVVCLFEQALVFNAEPEHLIKEAVAEYSKTRKGQTEVLPIEVPEAVPGLSVTPPRVDDVLNKQAGQPSPFDSSIIKYSVTKATPFKSRLKSCERPVVTPVRRSTRLERRSMHYPTLLQEHGLAVRHLDDLPEDIKKNVLFKPNLTVQNDLNEAWKALWNE